ncbi:hypothetical protein GCM10010168_81550 [Actinoplanes ianthinogenes]|uniref:FXSXX-COOH protein n=2 Tax=Actinoplanes ianthinogenes TaxID=122358 RepID=A0ABM7LML5_9ACTN|nr:hypothetical protein Aiant_11680 [Actinoplanes ianthinogenes]GGR50416.1 hypothetical protein GCM10010168_81550 [Actinoplanes ianthinogenes]
MLTTMPQDSDVRTEVPDLSRHTLAEVGELDSAALGKTPEALLRRVDQPSQSISGYNPQRLTD